MKHPPQSLTYSTFRKHLRDHINRVVLIGMEAIELFPKEFSKVDPTKALAFLKLHDQSKENDDPEFLRKYSIEVKNGTIAQRLFENIQIVPSSRNSFHDENFESLRNTLNSIDDAVAKDFFKSIEIPFDGEEAQILLRIEKIADLVDRAQDPVARWEFHREMQPAALLLNGPVDRFIATILESHYRKITDINIAI